MELPLLLLAAPLALVWGVLFLFRGSLVAGCLAFLLAACCFGYHFLRIEGGPLPLTIDRLVLVVLGGTYAFQRLTGRADPKPLDWADWAALGFVLVLTGTMLTSDWQDIFPGDVSPIWRLIGGYITPLAIYWFARQSPLDARSVGWVQGSLACFGIYLGVTALLEISGQWWAVFPGYIADPTVGLHYGRARGPMVHGVSYGHYQAVCLLAAYVWWLRLDRLGRAALLATVPLFLAGIFFSYTRSVWMGAAAGLLVVLLLVLRGPWRAMLLGGTALAGLLVLATSLESIVGFQREQSASETKESAELRVSFAYVSWQMFLDRPLLGFGFGRFPREKLAYLDDRTTELEINLLQPYVHHNTLLSLLVETGAIGCGLFLFFMLAWSRTAWRLATTRDAPAWMRHQGALALGAMAVYAPQLLFHELSYSSLDNGLLYLLMGVTTGLAARVSTLGQAVRATVGKRPSRDGRVMEPTSDPRALEEGVFRPIHCP